MALSPYFLTNDVSRGIHGAAFFHLRFGTTPEGSVRALYAAHLVRLRSRRMNRRSYFAEKKPVGLRSFGPSTTEGS
jgi:hypothetical protein